MTAGMRKPEAPDELMQLQKPSDRPVAAPPRSTEPIADEGTTPIRYPSIEPLGTVSPDTPIVFEIDLLQQHSENTAGEALNLETLAPSWSTLDVTVTLVSEAVDFDDDAKGVVTIRRNDRSQPARVSGHVRSDVIVGSTIDVRAQFFYGTRFSGEALRSLSVVNAAAAMPQSSESAPSAEITAANDVASAATTAAPAAPSPGSNRTNGTHTQTHGSVQVDTVAVMPDVTITISVDPAAPGRMNWHMVIWPKFATLPAKLNGKIDLGTDLRARTAEEFKDFAKLIRGQHERRFLGYGERLWDRSPAEFRNVYWALHDHFQRRLTIQFMSDDPYLPWELMAPYRTVDGVLEQHGPIALRHAVARWINQYEGLMRNTLPAGRLVAIAPIYKGGNRAKLRLTEDTVEELEKSFNAYHEKGTYSAMLKLLEDPPALPVGLLYFNGHGAVSTDSAASSLIHLEDGTLSVDDVAQQGVQLGHRDGPLVFFNACEVGATADLLGEVGGWASAFLSRGFRAFVAPLWAIEETDGVIVTKEFLTKILREGQSVGEALLDVRKAHGSVSPTFYSYLLFGDVTARFPQPPTVAPPSVIT
jgi:hypothetical protein